MIVHILDNDKRATNKLPFLLLGNNHVINVKIMLQIGTNTGVYEVFVVNSTSTWALSPI